jgi:hypothetical protein
MQLFWLVLGLAIFVGALFAEGQMVWNLLIYGMQCIIMAELTRRRCVLRKGN